MRRKDEGTLTPGRAEKSLPGRPGGPRSVSTLGPGRLPLCVEDAVRANLDGAPVLVPTHGALVAVAFVLARKLDEGAGMATAAVARELRETLDVLLGGPSDDDDGLSAFVDSLRTPMGDPAKP